MVYGAAKPPENFEFRPQFSEFASQFGVETVELREWRACVPNTWCQFLCCHLHLFSAVRTVTTCCVEWSMIDNCQRDMHAWSTHLAVLVVQHACNHSMGTRLPAAAQVIQTPLWLCATAFLYFQRCCYCIHQSKLEVTNIQLPWLSDGGLFDFTSYMDVLLQMIYTWFHSLIVP